MYLHLGQNTSVRYKDIIGVFDLDTSTVSKATRDYLAQAEKRSEVINIASDIPKSFIVCDDKARGNKRTIYLSQISAATLLKRSMNFLAE